MIYLIKNPKDVIIGYVEDEGVRDQFCQEHDGYYYSKARHIEEVEKHYPSGKIRIHRLEYKYTIDEGLVLANQTMEGFSKERVFDIQKVDKNHFIVCYTGEIDFRDVEAKIMEMIW